MTSCVTHHALEHRLRLRTTRTEPAATLATLS